MLADLPALAADLLEHAINQQPDMAVVARQATLIEVGELVRQTTPDVVVIGLRNSTPPVAGLALFATGSALSLLGVDRRDGRVHVYQLQHTALGEVAPDELITYLRASVRA